MRKLFQAILLSLTIAAAGCSTTQSVQVGTSTAPRGLSTAARVPQDGNSPEMDKHFAEALKNKGVTVNSAVAAGTRKADNVDILVTYLDVWRWDLVMFLQSLDVQLIDAQNGNLLVQGSWKDAPMHGFKDPKVIFKQLLDEMFPKIPTASK